MDDATRFRLRFGRYRTPRFRYGAKVEDARRGRVKIVGITNAPIPWLIGMKRGGKSPVLYGSLILEVQREPNQAVAYWWGALARPSRPGKRRSAFL